MRSPSKSNIAGLERKPQNSQGRFDDLPPDQQQAAQAYLNKILEKRRKLGKPITGWVLPILIGQARRLAKNPPSSSWGRSMLAKRGGLALQEKYRRESKDLSEKVAHTPIAKPNQPVKPFPLSRKEAPIKPRSRRRAEIDILHILKMRYEKYRELFGEDE